MPLDHWNCFAVVLRGMQGKVDICQTDYNIHAKERIFPYSNNIHGKIYNIQANERLTRVKEKQSTTKLRVFVLSFIFFAPIYQIESFINRSGTCYFLHTSVAHVLVSTCAIVCIKWRRLNNISYLADPQYTDLAKADSQLRFIN